MIDLKTAGRSVADLLLEVGFVKSKSEGRRQIQNGAVRIGETKITDPFARVVFYKDQTGKGICGIIERVTPPAS